MEQRVVFLDRDGVINENRDTHVRSWEEFRFLPGSLKALRRLTEYGFTIFVVTNQAVINRGLASEASINTIHQRMVEVAQQHGAEIRAVRYCPHRPDEQCRCRKPQPGMLQALVDAWGINPQRAYLVGDALSDIAAGQAMHCRTVLVRTGRGEAQLAAAPGAGPMPEVVVDNLAAAVDWIISQEALPNGLSELF